MATLQYNGTEYNILYIDPMIETAGDGTTPATALLDIPSPLVDNTCYLIRRGPDDEVYNVNMPQSWYESLYQIMFIGMPTQESPLWLALDEDVKEAWGADLGKYARVRCNVSAYQDLYTDYTMDNTNNKTLFKTRTIRNFVADSCYFYRDGEGPSAGNEARYFNAIFGFDYTSRFANISFNNCKFGYAQYNFENDDYINSNTNISKDTSKYPQYQCSSYILGNVLNSFSISNCIINLASTNKYTRYGDRGDNWYNPSFKSVFITNCNKTNCEDCIFNILYFDSLSNYQYNPNERLYFRGGDRSFAKIKNLTVNKIYTSTGAIIKNAALYASSNILQVDGIKTNYKVMGNGELTSYNSIDASSPIVYVYANVSYQICNITNDVSDSPVAYAKTFESNLNRISTGTVANKIENIFTNHNPNGKLNLGTPLVQLSCNSSFWNNSSDQVNVSINNTYTDNDYPTQLVPQRSCIANNIIVDCPIVNDNVLSVYRMGVKSEYIAGRVYLCSAVLDVKKIYHHFATSSAIAIDGNSFLKCDELEVNLNYPSYKGSNQIYWQRGSQSAVYIGKSNCIIADEVQNTGSNYIACMNSTLVCPNYIKPGQFFARNYNSFCKSWNVIRSGSNAQGSLRFNNNTNGQNNDILPLIIGQEPYKGIQVMPTSIGKKYAIGYVALKHFDETELSGCSGSFGYWVNTTEKITDPFDSEKTNTIIHSYDSDSFGWLVDNESTWSNDTNLRKYKIIVPFEVFNLEDPVEFKIWFNWYSINGYCYMDPDFKIVDSI